MRYKSIYLENYIGIYAGMHKYSLFIDFDKCKYGNIVLKGGNGAGKTSLFNAISLLPDSSESFIPEKSAIKIVRVYHDECIYEIKYIHDYKNGGYTTKGYFYKGFLDDEPNLCNPNGNITTCKDLIFSEFNLDANFESLCELSSTNRGIITKIPSMRKQNFNNIIAGVEAYNQIYKVLSKRSSVFKSMINSLVSKIKVTGDEQLLKSSLVSLEQRIGNLEASKEECIASIAKYENLIASLDPGIDAQSEYNSALGKYDLAKNAYNLSISNLKSLGGELHGIDYAAGLIDMKQLLSVRKNQIEEYKREKSRLFNAANDASKKLNEKYAKLSAINTDTNIEMLRDMKKEAETTIKDCESFFAKSNLVDLGISSGELSLILSIVTNFRDSIHALREEFGDELIKASCQYIPVTTNPPSVTMNYINIELSKESIEAEKHKLVILEQDMAKYKTLMEVASKLNNRPSNCKSESCFFIKDAIAAKNSNPEEEYKKLMKQYVDTKDSISSSQNILDLHKKINECGSRIVNIYRAISNSNINQDIPGVSMYCNPMEFISGLEKGLPFDISDIYSYISQAASFDNYKQAKATLEHINKELEMYDAKEIVITSIREDIAELTTTVKINSEKHEEITVELNELERNIEKLEEDISKYEKICEVIDKCNVYQIEMNAATIVIDKHKESMLTIKEARNNIALLTNSLNDTRANIKTLQRDASQIEYGIGKLAEYKAELEEFEAKFEKVEFLKKCSSPSKKGIQMIFIELYLRDIIRTANKLLSYVMGGEYSLLKPFIDDRSFNFPCMGKGIYHDDIASLSGGESAMVATILSGSIMYHSSTKYNILKFDEVDGQLDTSNRGQFLPTVNTIRSILKCEQAFIISHNEEIDLRNTDLIVLEGADEEVYTCGGNIIYDIHKTV